MALQIRDLHVAIADRVLLRSASFQVPAHQLTVIVGASGSGKSTLLRIIAGLQKEQQDRSGVQWSGEIQWTESEADRRVGLVFQQPALLDELSGQENIQLAIDHGRKKSIEAETDAENSWPKTAREWLDHLHVPTSTRISKLSGGQRQRLSLAQTLASQPSLIIFDEPTTGLDASHAHRVAELIRQTQTELGVTAIVVTHDYESFLEIADQVLLLDASQADIVPCRNTTRESMRELLESQIVATRVVATPITKANEPAQAASSGSLRWLNWFTWTMQDIGSSLEWTLARILDLLPRWPSLTWGIRFFAHYARLVTGLTAILYLAIAGGIIGFVATFFTLKYMPYKIYTEPLLLEELLGAIGFAIYRILIPVMTTILVAARCGAAVSADLGNKRYGNQVESLEMLHVPVERYLWTNVVWSFLIGTVFLNQVSFLVAQTASLAVHLNMHPELGAHFWSHHFYAPLRQGDSWLLHGFGWNLIKLTLAAFGTALITYRLAMRPKHSSSDVSRTITTTILWSTLWALLIHMVVAFYEFVGN